MEIESRQIARKGRRTLKLQIKIDGKTYQAEVEVLDEAESPENYPPYPPVVSTAQPMPSPVAHAPAHAVEDSCE